MRRATATMPQTLSGKRHPSLLMCLLGIACLFGWMTTGSARAASPDIADEKEGASPPDADAAAETVYANTLKWSTASEVDNFGYDIYRGEAEDGPFERITEDPVTGAGTTDEVSEYRFEDDTIDPYKLYYYYVESISMSGERERFTPIFPAKPKLQREDEADASTPDPSTPGEK